MKKKVKSRIALKCRLYENTCMPEHLYGGIKELRIRKPGLRRRIREISRYLNSSCTLAT